jgi:hypothetical protein
MLFFIGGFSSYMERIFYAQGTPIPEPLPFMIPFSSLRPLLVFLEALCFLAWWVGVLLLGERDEGTLSTEVID